MANHLWLRARYCRDRQRLPDDLHPVLATVDAHRRLRGPYTAAGTLLRQLVPAVYAAAPDVVDRHAVALLSSTPELRAVLPVAVETLTSLRIPAERTRFFCRRRTLAIAHGLVAFLRDGLAQLDLGPRTLVVHQAHRADPTDGEVLALLLRRMDPARLTLVVTTGTEPLDEPAGPLPAALAAHAVAITGPDAVRPVAVDDADVPTLARRYVAGHGTADDPALVAAYRRLGAAERARLHDLHAALLAECGEPSLALGAVPYHAEHGSDPAGAGVRALRAAADHCLDIGFHDAGLDLARRGRAVADRDRDPGHWWACTSTMATCLAALGRAAEAEPLYDEARASTASPKLHLEAAHATAMLHTRYLDGARRDLGRARGFANAAIAVASLLPDPAERALHTAFTGTGLALVELARDDAPAALRLVDRCVAELDAHLTPGRRALHRAVLLHNRARIRARLGRDEDALADLTEIIAADPNDAEYHFDRADVLRRLGRDAEALDDYERALRLAPPFPELYHGRGEARRALGDAAGALADFDTAVELDPSFVDAYASRARLYHDRGAHAAAWRDVDAGLALDPGNAHLLAVESWLHAEAAVSAPTAQ